MSGPQGKCAATRREYGMEINQLVNEGRYGHLPESILRALFDLFGPDWATDEYPRQREIDAAVLALRSPVS